MDEKLLRCQMRHALLDQAEDHTKLAQTKQSPEPKWKAHVECGWLVRIYAEDCGEPWTIHGALMEPNDGRGWRQAVWRSDGSCSREGFNLIPVQPNRRVYKTLNEIGKDYSFNYEEGRVTVYLDDIEYTSKLCGVIKQADTVWLEIFTKVFSV